MRCELVVCFSPSPRNKQQTEATKKLLKIRETFISCEEEQQENFEIFSTQNKHCQS